MAATAKRRLRVKAKYNGRTVVCVSCDHCKRETLKLKAEIDYRIGGSICRHVYCSQRCAGLARRVKRSKAEWVSMKAAYDRLYREKNRKLLKAKKAAWFQRSYDPVRAAKERKARAKWHVEYCRRYYADPVRKAEKVAYDARRRASAYGEFADAYMVYVRLNKENRKRGTQYERLRARGYFERKNEQRKAKRNAI